VDCVFTDSLDSLKSMRERITIREQMGPQDPQNPHAAEPIRFLANCLFIQLTLCGKSSRCADQTDSNAENCEKSEEKRVQRLIGKYVRLSFPARRQSAKCSDK